MALKNTQKNTVTRNTLNNYLTRLNPVKSGWDAVVESIGKKISGKKTPYGGGASDLLRKSSIDLSQGKKYIGGGASKGLTELSKSLYRGKKPVVGGGASTALTDLSKALYHRVNPDYIKHRRSDLEARKKRPIAPKGVNILK